MSMKVITLENLSRFANRLKDYFVQIKDSVRSVNGNFPDADGDVNVSRVPWAAELESESTQGSDAEFTVRTAGGEASIESGSAWLNAILGKSVKNGYVPEVLEWSVIAIERENPITATLNEDTFRTYVQTSQDITLTYTTDWSASPTLYGFTITGTPVAGDQITVHYVKLDLGTITNATPTAFVSTGWNQFDSVNGYARVINYGGSWRIDGNYSTVKFAVTPTGTQSSLTVTGDILTGFPEDWTEGYVIVTGGDNSTTAIYPTWSDWDDGYAEHTNFAVFSKRTIDLSTVMNGDGDQVDGLFPHGLMAVGTSRDEINLNIAQATSRIERLTNNETNMAEVIASGRPYDYDTGYIYVVRETPVTTALSGSYALEGSYTVSDHGLEWFEGSDIPVPCQTIYGTSLKNKLERDVLTISQQTLTSGQQTQVRTNIGAAGAEGLALIGTIKSFSLSSSQKLLTVADNNDICPIGISIINLANGDDSDLPSSSYKYGKAIVEKYATHRIVVTIRSVIDSTKVAVNRMDSSNAWLGWRTLVDSNDVYNGLDKTSAGFVLDARQGKKLMARSTVNTLVVRSSGTASGTSGSVSTYGGRKFSDYWMLGFFMYSSTSDSIIRDVKWIDASHWNSGAVIQTIANHGASLGSVSGIQFSYNSDTSVSVITIGAGSLTNFEIIGLLNQ